MLKVVDVRRADSVHSGARGEFEVRVILAHDERHLRRKTLELSNHSKVLIDLAEATVLNAGDMLLLEDGNQVLIEAADEDLYDIRGRDPVHLLQLAWHIGNRHLPAELRADRILICRDHVIKAMLEGLGATTTEIRGAFVPARGAYSGQSTDAGHSHHH